MPIKTSTAVFFVLKAYFFVAFIYFLFLLYQFNQSGSSGNAGNSAVNFAVQAILWPRDLLTYLQGGTVYVR